MERTETYPSLQIEREIMGKYRYSVHTEGLHKALRFSNHSKIHTHTHIMYNSQLDRDGFTGRDQTEGRNLFGGCESRRSRYQVMQM